MEPFGSLATTHPPQRGVFCNRTLNMRGIRAIGYDMDYTLVHYEVARWEARAYAYMQESLAKRGWPVAELKFNPTAMLRGLVIDRELGNIVKANRFGYVKQAYHGTQRLRYEEQRTTYSRTVVDLSDSRWAFLNTFFSLSEAHMYAQLVDMLDAKQLPEVLGYHGLANAVRQSSDEAHMEGLLKAEIINDPAHFVVLDPETPRTLLEQKWAGKRLMLITNSEWSFASVMMAYAFDPFLPESMTWRDLFDLVIVSSRKPVFFTARNPFLEVVEPESGLMRYAQGPSHGAILVGGNAEAVEQYLGLSGAQILYVGDHLYTDVHISKRLLRWRTALIVREIESELEALDSFRTKQRELSELMGQKRELERLLSHIRLELTRHDHDAAQVDRPLADAKSAFHKVRSKLLVLDSKIGPLARAASERNNKSWGLLMRTGSDKSMFAHQVERYSDIYTSRVSNFMVETPYGFLRSVSGRLPHDEVIEELAGD